MDGRQSKEVTPLEVMVKHFKEAYQPQDYGCKWDRQKLRKICETEWPTFGIGWPPVGTLDIPTTMQVHRRVFHPTLGHPDQGPYIDVWLDLLNHPPPWLRRLKMQRSPPPPLCTAGRFEEGSEGEESGGVSDFMARLDRLSPYIKSPPRSEAMDRSVQVDRSQPSTSTPKEGSVDPTPSTSALGTSAMTEPVVARTRAKTEQASLTAPLRQVDQLAINPKDPSESVADLVKTIMDAHNPNWLDIQQLLGTLFSPEEREKIKNAVTELLKPDVRLYHSMEDLLREKYPSNNPDWDMYRDDGKDRLRDYQALLVRAIRLARKPVINMSKPSLVLQEPTERPEAFYTRLIDSYRMYTPIDPTVPENARMLTMAFISQSAPDIRRKLQRLEGALGKPITSLNLWSD
uniref:Core shell protein Gag P30 domain-containing protein n=1 Tax=Pseudonaja textilis TaxID=8673 RepID=A0A670ZKH6_PSETE